MKDASKSVSFRLEIDEWNELARRAETVKQSPGGYARAVLFRELQGDAEVQLEGMREEIKALMTPLALLDRKLVRLNNHLRKTLTTLLVEISKPSDTTEAEDLAQALVPSLEGKHHA